MFGAQLLAAANDVVVAATDATGTDEGGGASWLILVAVLVGLIGLGAPLYVIIGAFIFACYGVFPEYADPFGDNFVNNFDGTGSMVGLVDTPELVAIPFFMIAGVIMGRGAIAQRLVDFANAMFAWLPGGLAVSTIFACAFFAAISGSSPVTVVTIGAVMVPALKAAGYTEKMSYGLVTSAGGLGIIIPPSIPMVVYAIYASVEGKKVRVDDIFLAGIIPGALIALILATYCVITCRKIGGRVPFSFARLYRTFLDGIWALFLPVFILGGIYLSLFNAIEAAAMSVVIAIIVEVWIHKSLKLRAIPGVLSEMSVLMGAILIIITIAMRFTQFVEDQRITEDIAVWLEGMDLSPFVFILILNGLLLIVGCLLDIISAIVLFVPLLVPIALQCGIDPLHLGLIFIVNLEIGYLTPPLGLNLFVATTYFEKPFGLIVKAVAPFLVMMLCSLAIISYVPTVSLAISQAQKGEPIWVPFPDGESCNVTQAVDEDSMKHIMESDDEINEMFDEYLDEDGGGDDDFDGGDDDGGDLLDLDDTTDDFDAEPQPDAEKEPKPKPSPADLLDLDNTTDEFDAE